MVDNRATLVMELEEIFGKRVFAIVYNRNGEEGVKEGDEKYFKHFIDEIIKKEHVRDCVLILNGPGGNLKTSIICSQLLRDNLQRYDLIHKHKLRSLFEFSKPSKYTRFEGTEKSSTQTIPEDFSAVQVPFRNQNQYIFL